MMYPSELRIIPVPVAELSPDCVENVECTPTTEGVTFSTICFVVSEPSEEVVPSRLLTMLLVSSLTETSVLYSEAVVEVVSAGAVSEDTEVSAAMLLSETAFWRYAPPNPEAPPTIATASIMAIVFPAPLPLFFLPPLSSGTSI